MFTRVLIAEDHQSLKISIEQTLRNLGVMNPEYVYYCDNALQRLQWGVNKNVPFEILITDLSFDEDGTEQQIKNGTSLIQAARRLQPHLKVLVFSIESNPAVVRDLFEKYQIDGFVKKSRNDAVDLNDAITALAKNKKYIPVEFRQAIRDKNAYDFTDYDLIIISQTAQGISQKKISEYLKQLGAKAASLRSVEKQLGSMRSALGFKNNAQLIAYCKDRRII